MPTLGEYLGRNVTVIRLHSGELMIHSTAPFTPGDVDAISALGRPAYLVEGIPLHDTFTKDGHDAFPNVPSYAPEGFSEMVGFPTESLTQPPAAWAGELDCLELAGKSAKATEYVFLHRPPRTLIVTDLAFNVTEEAPVGARLFASVIVIGGVGHDTGMSRVNRFTVEDHTKFQRSVETLLAWTSTG